MTESIQCKSTS